MKLLTLDLPELYETVAGWLARPENHQWLDFSHGPQPFTPALVRIMAQRGSNFMRVYTSDRDDTPIGVVGLTHVDRAFRTATFWGLSGDKSFHNRGYSTIASSKLMTLAFRDLGLHAINTWAVDHNPSLRTIERLGFRFVGRLRQCHYIDGQRCDRLMFDLLSSEFRELDEARWHRNERSRRDRVWAQRLAQPG